MKLFKNLKQFIQVFLSSFLIVSFSFHYLPAYAQDENLVDEAIEPAPSLPTSERVSEPPTSVQSKSSDGSRVEARDVGEGKISMDFKDALLSEVLSVLSSLTQVSFVTSEEASNKKINLFLENVKFEDALKAIVQGNGLIAQRVGESNIYMVRIGTGEDALIPLETKVFKVKYIRVTKVKELSIAESSSSSSDSSSGSSSSPTSSSVGSAVSIAGGEPAEIKDTIEDLLSPRGKVTVSDRDNSLIVTDTPDRLEHVEKVLKILDHPLDQVLIEAIILERSADFDKTIGNDWSLNNAGASDGRIAQITGARGKIETPNMFQPADLIDRGSIVEENTGISFGQLDLNDMQALVKALQTDTRSKILAKPRILVLNNEPAFIKITVNAVIGVNSQTSAGTSGGDNITSETAERSELGVTLKVTPLINDDRLITLLLEPRYSTAEISSFNDDFRDPRIRASRTTLAVESGKVVTISGLMQREETKTHRKVPILGDVPFFGVFFSRWTTDKADRELIIFLRPFIIKHGEFGLVQTKKIPDEMTSADEEAAEFWKIWEKPWYKKKTQKEMVEKDIFSDEKTRPTEDFSDYFEERNQAMDEALSQYATQMETEVIEEEVAEDVATEDVQSGEAVEEKAIEEETASEIVSDQLENDPNNNRDMVVTPIQVNPA